MEELLLEHRGYKCIAKRNKDGRWFFGNGPDIERDNDSPFDFLSYANNEKEAKRIYASLVDNMIDRQEYHKEQKLWESKVDKASIVPVINILPELFNERIKAGKFDKSLLNGVEGGDYIVPLYYVTKAWDVLLKGSLGTIAFMIGPEEEDDFSEDELKQFLKEEGATRSRGEATVQNDKMKELWKVHFDIDIDSLNVDFSKFDMHMPPNVTNRQLYDYFQYVPDGVVEWIMNPINHPSEEYAYHEEVSCLMEFVAYVLKYEQI